MKNRLLSLMAALATLYVVGCSRSASGPEFFSTDELESLEVLRLRPFGDESEPAISNEPAPNRFHGWLIADRVMVSNRRTQREISQLVGRGFKEGEAAGVAMACFDPRHGVIARGKNTTCELVICFECDQAFVYRDGKAERRLTKDAPMELLDEVLGLAEPMRREGIE